MMKSIKTVIFALFVSSVLALNGLAQNGGYWQDKPKEKPREQPKESPKKEDRGGGKQEDKKKEKKPDDDSV